MIDAKQSFLGQVRHRCAEELTAADADRLMVILSDVMEGFRMEELDRSRQDVRNDDMQRACIDSLTVQGRSPTTIERYELMVGRFMQFVAVPVRSVTVYHVREWLADGKKRGLMDSTLEGDRAVLSSFFGWLFREGLIEKNPMMNVGVIKVAKKEKKTYTDIDIEKLN